MSAKTSISRLDMPQRNNAVVSAITAKPITIRFPGSALAVHGTARASSEVLAVSVKTANSLFVTSERKVAGLRPGQSLLTKKKVSTVPNPAIKMAASKLIGTNAGSEFHGFPPTLIGQLIADAHN